MAGYDWKDTTVPATRASWLEQKSEFEKEALGTNKSIESENKRKNNESDSTRIIFNSYLPC